MLRGSAGTELARYPFTPDPVEGGPRSGEEDRNVDALAISELAPYVAGSNRRERDETVANRRLCYTYSRLVQDRCAVRLSCLTDFFTGASVRSFP